MGNKVAKQDRSLSPLSSWGSKFDLLVNSDYDDSLERQRIVGLRKSRSTRKNSIDEILPDAEKPPHTSLSTRRRESLELKQLELDRRTNSPDSLTTRIDKDPVVPTKRKTKKTKKKEEQYKLNPSEPHVQEENIPTSYDPDVESAVQPYGTDFVPLDPSIVPDADIAVPGMIQRRKKTTASLGEPTEVKELKENTTPERQKYSFSDDEVMPRVKTVKKKKRVTQLKVPSAPVHFREPFVVPVDESRITSARSMAKVVVPPKIPSNITVRGPINPPANPVKFLAKMNKEKMSKSRSLPRLDKDTVMMKRPPGKTVSDLENSYSGISAISSYSTASTRVVGTKKMRGKTPPKPFKISYCPDDFLDKNLKTNDLQISQTNGFKS